MGNQRAKKVMSDSLGLVDYVIGPVNSVLNLPDRQMVFLGEFKLQKNCNQSCSSIFFFRLVEMMSGLVHARYLKTVICPWKILEKSLKFVCLKLYEPQFHFTPLLLFWPKLSDALLKYTWSKLTPTNRELCWSIKMIVLVYLQCFTDILKRKFKSEMLSSSCLKHCLN